MALSLPLVAWAQVPVQDGSDGSYAGNSSNSSYGTTGAYVGGGVQTPSSAQAALFNQLQQMQQEIAQLRGLLEEQQNQLQQLKQEGLERYQELDRRVGSGSTAGVGPQNIAVAGGASAAAANAGEGAATQAAAESADPAKEKLFYDAAFDQIKAKDFDKASQAFAAFLRRYPNSQYAGNAQYWLGEVNLAKGDLQAAGEAFAKVSQVYPQHAKVADSLFKLGDVELRLGHNAKAKGILQQVVAQYPGTSAAQLAQRNLQRLP